MNMNSIHELTRESHEILTNIKAAAHNGDITWQQREQLVALVNADTLKALTFARNLLHDWTGVDCDAQLPKVE